MKLDFQDIATQAILLLSLINGVSAESMSATCEQDCPAPYVENEFWTTAYGPAAANIVLSPTNFLACSADSYALCYYSGPDAAPTGKHGKRLPGLPCKVSKDDPATALCRCYAETGMSYIDIHAIRNTEAYIETVRTCGLDGGKCANMASEAAAKLAAQLGQTPPALPIAPVCGYLQAGSNGRVSMAPDAELISTFSFARVQSYGTAQTDCTAAAMPYAGCMTASCAFERDKNGKRTGFANCKCPVYSGPYQVGQAGISCDAGSGNVWSAAYAPPAE